MKLGVLFMTVGLTAALLCGYLAIRDYITGYRFAAGFGVLIGTPGAAVGVGLAIVGLIVFWKARRPKP